MPPSCENSPGKLAGSARLRKAPCAPEVWSGTQTSVVYLSHLSQSDSDQTDRRLRLPRVFSASAEARQAASPNGLRFLPFIRFYHESGCQSEHLSLSSLYTAIRALSSVLFCFGARYDHSEVFARLVWFYWNFSKLLFVYSHPFFAEITALLCEGGGYFFFVASNTRATTPRITRQN